MASIPPYIATTCLIPSTKSAVPLSVCVREREREGERERGGGGGGGGGGGNGRGVRIF